MSLAKHKNITVFMSNRWSFSGPRMVVDGVKGFQERKLIMIKGEN
jgi:hypothetical protein